MQKLLILEEQLYNAKSHHFSYYKSILSAAKNAGLDPVLYVNKGAEESVYRQLGATPAMLTMAGLAASGTEHVHNRFLRFFMLVKNLIGNLFICRGALTSLPDQPQRKLAMVSRLLYSKVCPGQACGKWKSECLRQVYA